MRSTFDRQTHMLWTTCFFKILPVGHILSLYALVESSLPHRNLLNSSLASDLPQSAPGEPREGPRQPKEFKIMINEARSLPRDPQYMDKLPINRPSGRYVYSSSNAYMKKIRVRLESPEHTPESHRSSKSSQRRFENSPESPDICTNSRSIAQAADML